MAEIVRKAFVKLFPDKDFSYDSQIRYSRRLKGYNANVRMRARKLEFSLAMNWETVDDDIKEGLIQELLAKLFKSKKFTKEMQLYKIFVKKLALATPKELSDPLLEDSFRRVNKKYFGGLMEQPNLRFGRDSVRTVGSYNFHSDTITISGLLRRAPEDILDYVMYHELLHKKLKFDHTKREMRHHTKEFRSKEKDYEDSDEVEKRLDRFLRRKRFPLF